MRRVIFAFGLSVVMVLCAERAASDTARVTDAALAAASQKRLVAVQGFLKAFYASRDDLPAWTERENVETALQILADAKLDGLDPEDFAYTRLRELSQSGHSTKFDVELTANLILLGHVLHQGKLDPEFLRSDTFWQRVASRDPVLDLNIALETGQLREAMKRARPQFTYYADLRKELATYRTIAEGGGWPTVSDGDVLRLGDQSPRVGEIARRLIASGHLGTLPSDPSEFDTAIEEAVKAFQAQHGEDADGIVGKRTIAAMNVPVEERIDQIRVNMERARWIGDLPDQRHVIVNIAGFYAALMDDAKPTWTTRVIVGKDFTQTPVFVDEIEYLEFNPTWTAPRSIIRNELAPKIIADPSYLARNDYYLATANGRAVNPRSVNWSVLSARNFPYWVVQKPGEKNALGRVKFMFPNEHSVYMHDTPSRELFGRSLRTFSHGCIRTENPLELAELLLRGQGWDQARIQSVLNSGQQTRVSLDQPVPVALLYWTVDPTNDGVRFHRDIYDRDGSVLRALNAPLQ